MTPTAIRILYTIIVGVITDWAETIAGADNTIAIGISIRVVSIVEVTRKHNITHQR
ncbi:hypothetical protein LTSEMIS_0516 [Salmonella enterica subsp. enterica serovar Mississippi str. A4-633]|nr:hypothetical protein LTSEMIS_0516 [Salmonella enterica subsp. enterica serovar Mississippi str. A4-633]